MTHEETFINEDDGLIFLKWDGEMLAQNGIDKNSSTLIMDIKNYIQNGEAKNTPYKPSFLLIAFMSASVNILDNSKISNVIWFI